MSKIILNIECENAEEAEVYLKAYKYKHMLDDIWEECFRPNRKHGYGIKILDKEESHDIIEEIAEIYLRIIRED